MLFKYHVNDLRSYHICEAERAIEQEALRRTSQQDLMCDHGGAQHLPATQHTFKRAATLSTASYNNSLSGSEHEEVPESGEPLDSQQRTCGEFGEGHGEEEEGHRTPVLRAQLLDHLQQHAT